MARLDGDGAMTWADARLTPKGEEQSLQSRDFWAEAYRRKDMPLPEKYYVSPLTRCLQTAQITFSPLIQDELARPVVEELVRERYGVHTCDRRSRRSLLQEKFPGFDFDTCMPEEDELWEPDRRETIEEHAERMRKFLDKVFERNETFISVTTHTWSFTALYSVLEHQGSRVAAGATLAFLIRAKTV